MYCTNMRSRVQTWACLRSLAVASAIMGTKCPANVSNHDSLLLPVVSENSFALFDEDKALYGVESIPWAPVKSCLPTSPAAVPAAKYPANSTDGIYPEILQLLVYFSGQATDGLLVGSQESFHILRGINR